MTSDEYYAWMLSDDRLFYQVVKDAECPKIRKIHGLKQAQVEEIYKAARDIYFDVVKRVIIFGSSVTINCWRGSDLDVCIDWVSSDEQRKCHGYTERESEFIDIIRKATDCNFDWLDYREYDDSRVYRDIRTKGIIVYEQSI